MRPSAALDMKRSAVRKLAARFRTENSRVCGPRVDGTGREGSGLDLLVDTFPATTSFDLGGLQDALKMLPGVQVDANTPGALPIKFRTKVLSQRRTGMKENPLLE
ncbi:nucleotidyltransferase family protein [Ottowia caeni]|uniref:nucleotidyltransferase family protein n=1 Tax=Ottowia caeni TaxID=2870339 RepID=UPI001E5A951F